MKRFLLALTLVVSVCFAAHAQVGTDTNLWEFKRFHEDKSAVVIQTDMGHGTGICISNGRIITAYHIIAGDVEYGEDEKPIYPEIRVKYQTGPATTAKVESFDQAHDILILIPRTMDNDQLRVRIATSDPKPDDLIRFTGFGHLPEVDQLRSWAGRVSRIDRENMTFYDTTCIPGDSGGGCFNSKGELVGIILGGQIFLHINCEHGYVRGQHLTRSPDVAAINSLVKPQTPYCPPGLP